MALCFLPAEHIENILRRLKKETDTLALNQFAHYMDTPYIRCFQSIWVPASWSVYRLNIRTNNGWHNRQNSRGSAQMPLYMMALLNDEVSLVQIQVRLASDNNIQRAEFTAEDFPALGPVMKWGFECTTVFACLCIVILSKSNRLIDLNINLICVMHACVGYIYIYIYIYIYAVWS
ncbi:hypothetical protein LSH36_163g04026 [Paralvinella palmiformis]|uniref:Uncharacterized protein n=1 Tax=Paralvinella palmiformis TaxID=53620 RepID=A0AAD9JT99_9ANNE|nr:hypothetical protein LSH36_163g04026 [Paralvinella palmiformis]